MDYERALARLTEIRELIDRYATAYDRYWYSNHPMMLKTPGLAQQVNMLADEVRGQVTFANALIAATGEKELAARVVEHDEGAYGGHSFAQARNAIVDAIAILVHQDELAEIAGPAGPRLSASELHPVIWHEAAGLWDGGYFWEAVKAAADALEGKLQALAGLGVSGADLAKLFALDEPTQECPRLRLHNIDPDPESKTWKSAHTGAASLVRGAFMGVRNLVSHPGWPKPDAPEALEMLAVLSYVAHLIDRCDVEKAK
jgi:hypothetical protein